MEVGQRSRGARSTLSQINVTPFVDVMLVLLVIFMVTAPMMDTGLEVDLPEVREAAQLEPKAEPVILTVKKDGRIFVADVRVEGPGKLAAVLTEISQGKKDLEVFLEADREAAYGLVVEVMAQAKKAGVEKLGMVTRLPEP